VGKKFRSGRCAHCLQTFDTVTSDHVFPQSWYRDTTPPNQEKWQMPSCAPCNQRYKRIEEDLFLRISLCVDPYAPEAAGIATRVHRSLDPAVGRDARDRAEREKRRHKFKRTVVPREQVPSTAIYPHFGPYPRLAPEDEIPIGIPVDFLKAFAEKVIRGTTYVLDGAYIESDQEIVILPPLHDEDAAPIVNTIDRDGEWHPIGPGFRVGRAAGWFAIQIWGQLWIYGRI
jgi:hypothetical protein